MVERKRLEEILGNLVDDLAAIEHERWSDWQKYLHSQCSKQTDGSLIIPPELVRRWERQAATSYGELSNEEKESDRVQVQRYLPIISAALLE